MDRRVLTDLTRLVLREGLDVAESNLDSETSVLYVDDAEMREMNLRFRKIDRPTDVLSFAMREGGEAGPPVPLLSELLGDIVVSLETAQRQAEKRGHSLRREIAILLIHGMLHLLGHDHEAGANSDPKKRAVNMRKIEKQCLERLEKRLVV
jgi:probable rRNA maturation factor